MKRKYGNNKVLSLQIFYTIVLDELVLEVAIRSRNDALAEHGTSTITKHTDMPLIDSMLCGYMVILVLEIEK